MRSAIDPEGVRILVVDDEESIRDLVSTGLRFAGFEVDTASDGREALGKIPAVRPDLVLLDISMPELTGIEVLEQLRRNGVDVPVVFLTARHAPGESAHALRIGADDYVTNPFSLDDLVARIEAVLPSVSPARSTDDDR